MKFIPLYTLDMIKHEKKGGMSDEKEQEEGKTIKVKRRDYERKRPAQVEVKRGMLNKKRKEYC
jgi:hypothetical protein